MALGCHGEANALAMAAREGVSVKGAQMYSIFSPCQACSNLIAVAGIAEVGYLIPYNRFDCTPYLRDLGIAVKRYDWLPIFATLKEDGRSYHDIDLGYGALGRLELYGEGWQQSQFRLMEE